jgi:hypothetical protein
VQTIRIEASNDVVGKIISFLNTLPKEKARYISDDTAPSPMSFDPKRYFGIGNATRQEIDRYLGEIRSEWDSISV